MKINKMLIMAAFVFFVNAAMGATITFNGLTEHAAGSYHLTDLGNVDWACWNDTTDPASGAPTYEMTGGSAIGTITAVGGASVRGTSSGSTGTSFIFSNPSGSAVICSGVFNSTLNTAGCGVQLGITLADAGQAYQIKIFSAGYGTQHAAVVATLGSEIFKSGSLGGDGVSPEPGYYGDSFQPRETYLYTFTVVPDSDNQTFTFVLTSGGSQSDNSHVTIMAAAVSEALPVLGQLPVPRQREIECEVAIVEGRCSKRLAAM